MSNIVKSHFANLENYDKIQSCMKVLFVSLFPATRTDKFYKWLLDNKCVLCVRKYAITISKKFCYIVQNQFKTTEHRNTALHVTHTGRII